jgi:DNA-binding NtrC family response regulator
VPSLHERVEDIPVLARQLLDHVSADLGVHSVEISDEAMRYLQSYPWPGNIRELRNILERAVLLGDQKLLTAKDLHFDMRVDTDRFDDGAIATLEEVERTQIERTLRILGGQVPEAAKRLGIPRSSLYNKIKQYRIVHDLKTTPSAAESDTRVDAETPEHFADKSS